MKKNLKYILPILAVLVLMGATVRQQNILRMIVGALPSSSFEGDVAYDPTDDTLSLWDTVLGTWHRMLKESDVESRNMYPDYEANFISNVSTYDDNTAAPVDGTGGTATSLSRDLTTTNVISRSKNLQRSYLFSKGTDVGAGDAVGQGWSVTVPISPGDAESGRPMNVSFHYETTSGYDNVPGGNIIVMAVYLVGSNTIQYCSGRTLGGSVSFVLPVATVATQFSCTFWPSSSDTSVRLLWHMNDSKIAAFDLKVDRIKIHPDFTVPAPIVTDWESCTVTGAWIANTTYTARCRRVGDNLMVSGTLTISGGAPTSANLSINLPSGFTITTSKLPSTNNTYTFVGNAKIREDGVGTADGFAVYNDTSSVSILYEKQTTSDDSDAYGAVTATVPGPFNTGDAVYFDFSVPVNQYTNGSALVSTTQVDYQTVKVNASATASQALTLDVTNLQYETEVTDTHNAWNGTQFTAPITATYDVNGIVRTGTSSQKSVTAYINGSPYRVINSNAATGVIAKYSGIIPLNRGDVLSLRLDVSETKSASVNAMNWITIEARPNFSTFGVYGLYEYTEAEVSALNYTVSSDTYVDATGGSITLTPGTWQVCYEGSVYLERASTSPGNSCKTVLRDGSNNDINGTARLLSIIQDSVFASFVSPVSACAEVTISSSTTYKMSLKNNNAAAVSRCTFWSGGSNYASGITDPDGESKIWARRMK